MPGPSMTLSRCAPAITTLSSFLSGSSADDVEVAGLRRQHLDERRRPGPWDRATPSAKLAPTTGSRSPASSLGSVPTIKRSRSGVFP